MAAHGTTLEQSLGRQWRRKAGRYTSVCQVQRSGAVATEAVERDSMAGIRGVHQLAAVPTEFPGTLKSGFSESHQSGRSVPLNLGCELWDKLIDIAEKTTQAGEYALQLTTETGRDFQIPFKAKGYAGDGWLVIPRLGPTAFATNPQTCWC
jgi:hypothetical protein